MPVHGKLKHLRTEQQYPQQPGAEDDIHSPFCLYHSSMRENLHTVLQAGKIYKTKIHKVNNKRSSKQMSPSIIWLHFTFFLSNYLHFSPDPQHTVSVTFQEKFSFVCGKYIPSKKNVPRSFPKNIFFRWLTLFYKKLNVKRKGEPRFGKTV